MWYKFHSLQCQGLFYEFLSYLIASNINRYIKIPTSDQACSENKRLFEKLRHDPGVRGLPSIDGAIYCIYIRLIHTRLQNNDEVYRNQKY